MKFVAGFVFSGFAVAFLVLTGPYFMYADSASMLPAVNPGELLVCFRTGKNLPERYAVVCFDFETDGVLRRRVKRVLGLPGDTVEIKNRRFYLNGEPLEEPYLYEKGIVYGYGPETVPENHLFLLGDNRNYSYDSTEWGFFPAGGVTGEVFMVCWPHIKMLNRKEL